MKIPKHDVRNPNSLQVQEWTCIAERRHNATTGSLFNRRVCVCTCTGVHGNADEDALFSALFYTRRYNRLTRPVFNLSQSIDVQLGLVLQKIVQVVCNSSQLHHRDVSSRRSADAEIALHASRIYGTSGCC